MQRLSDMQLLILLLAATLTTATLSAQALRGNAGFRANSVERNDDGSSERIQLPFTINFFGVQRNQLWVNNNGNVTLDSPLDTYTANPLQDLGQEIIAPFWADVDTRGTRSSLVTYGTDTVNGRPAFGVNWVNVGYYSGRDDKLNSFQLIIIDRSDTGPGNVDFEFNYERIQWETGEASGGVNGFGGDSARVGYSNGTARRETSFELPGSGINGNLLDNGAGALIRRSIGSDVPGRLVFQIRNGGIVQTLSTNTSSLVFDSSSAGVQVPGQDLAISSSAGTLAYEATAATQSGGSWLSLGLSGGTTPGTLRVQASSAGLAPGGYNGTITVRAPGNAAIAPLVIPIVLNVGANIPYTTRAGVVNGASFVAGVVAPGSLFSIFGVRLADSTVGASTLPFPTTLGNISVSIAGRNCPLLLVSEGQINANVPYNLPQGSQPLVITRNGVRGAAILVDVAAALPGIFILPNTNNGIIQNQDASLNSILNPARPGTALIVYLTGHGNVDFAPADGAPASTTQLARVVVPVTANIDGRNAEVLFAGLTPGFVGLAQVNVIVPADTPGGPRQLQLRFGTAASAPVITHIAN
jgi:uncharacterized protein (TIGR03437 family)